MKEPIVLKISKAASMLGVARSTVTRWANNGSIGVIFTVGGQRRVPLAEVERLLISQPLDRAERAEKQTRAAREALAAKRGKPINTNNTEYPPETKADASGLDIDEAQVVAFGKILEQWQAARNKPMDAPEQVLGDGFDDFEEGDI